MACLRSSMTSGIFDRFLSSLIIRLCILWSESFIASVFSKAESHLLKKSLIIHRRSFITLIMRFVTLFKAFHFVLDALCDDDIWGIYTSSDDFLVSKFIFLLVEFPILRVIFYVQKWWKTLSLAVVNHPISKFGSSNDGWQILWLLKLLIYCHEIVELFQSAATNSNLVRAW